MSSSIRHTYVLLTNLALAVLKCHHLQLPAPCFSPKAGKAVGNPCLKLSFLVCKGGKHTQEDIPVCNLSVYKGTYTRLQTLHYKHQSFKDFNTEISSVSSNEAKEKQKKFSPKAAIGDYYIKKKYKMHWIACLSKGQQGWTLSKSESLPIQKTGEDKQIILSINRF